MVGKLTKENRGITLIAMVITSVVLLILAGVSIRMIIGDNGITRHAIIAKEKMENASELEKVKLAVAYAMMNNNHLTTNDLKKALKEELNIKDTDIDSYLTKKSDGWKFKADKDTYIIENDGNVYLYGDLENLKSGDYIKYDTTIQDSGTIFCRVLYDTDYNESRGKNYGIKIVSVDSIENVDLGYNDISITDTTNIPQISNDIDFNKAAYSYNNALETLNSIAQKYLNKTVAYSARCVTSNPLDSIDRTSEDNNYMDVNLEFEPCVDIINFKKDWYDNSDIEQMTSLDILKSNVNYWTMQRYNIYDSKRILFGIMYTDVSTNKKQYTHFCQVDENRTTAYAPKNGFRAVFTLKSSTKIISGKGTLQEPYELN